MNTVHLTNVTVSSYPMTVMKARGAGAYRKISILVIGTVEVPRFQFSDDLVMIVSTIVTLMPTQMTAIYIATIHF